MQIVAVSRRRHVLGAHERNPVELLAVSEYRDTARTVAGGKRSAECVNFRRKGYFGHFIPAAEYKTIAFGTNGDVLVIQCNEDITLPKFLYYVLASDRFFNYDNSCAKGAKMPRGDKELVMQYSFYIPSLEKQAEIVSILDRFDALCNDLTSGLPAEIEARQKQYEHYRDKLLTFS